PGNGGTASLATNIALDPADIKGLVNFAEKEKIDLTVVGPELPLTLGLVDAFEEKGLRIFGPRKNAAILEGSKVFAKQFMDRHRIPTARYQIAESAEEARNIVASGEFNFPLVVKADGLAGGKGVIVCRSLTKAEEAIQTIMVDKKFGQAGDRVVIEEFLRGKEASFIVVTDGVRVNPLVTTMDHKAAYDGDKGPNTGGMGAISPSPFISAELFSEVMKLIVFPTITRMLEEGRKFVGVLYVGLMLTDEGPKVLEYNCRFGDPETQPQMLRFKSDLVELLLAAIEGNVLQCEVEWSPRPAGCVVLASGGYPFKYEKGKKIEGLAEAEKIPGIVIFHAGTKVVNGEFYTNGGRVLNVCASDETLSETMEKIYEACEKIYFEAMHYRRDIGVVRE
ncbi:MAG: phosphoribosylamine--glycine ligase, partial [Candidatus Aminicenantes bacterium]